MYYGIRMQSKIINIEVELPILAGSISTARSTCGKPNCACKKNPPQLHGTYYRWTGIIAGKRTTKTISKEEADECMKLIGNYRNLQKKVENLISQSLKQAPWNQRVPKKR